MASASSSSSAASAPTGQPLGVHQPDEPEVTVMDLQTAAVAHRTAELRRLARQLRLERHRRPSGRVVRLRHAVGRRLVAIGASLLDASQAPATR